MNQYLAILVRVWFLHRTYFILVEYRPAIGFLSHISPALMHEIGNINLMPMKMARLLDLFLIPLIPVLCLHMTPLATRLRAIINMK